MANIYFSDFFDVDPENLNRFGVVDISLVGDLPLFIDPFLLFGSKNAVYRALHDGIIDYMRFLKEQTIQSGIRPALVSQWFAFPEVRQNWLGFSTSGNHGHGLGREFAEALHRNFNTVFTDFGEETLTQASHLEKLCLIRDGVGRDTISDFTTNLIKPYLLGLTQEFARQHLGPNQRRNVAVNKVHFNYETRAWMPEVFELPYYNGDYVILTPKDILTKDEAWINRADLMDNFEDIAMSVPDEELRAQLNDYFYRQLSTKEEPSREQRRDAATHTIERFPKILDYYIREKEEHSEDAAERSQNRVQFVEDWFIAQVRQFVGGYLEKTGFYDIGKDTYDEAMNRLLFLKDVIENKGGHNIFYHNGEPVQRETDLHILYRMTWYATPSDISREVNDGRGPADFKASRGAADKVIIEFKLAKNNKLEKNLRKQAEIYEKASDATYPSIKAIVYFSERELERVQAILLRLKLSDSPHIVLIDASDENKPSGSLA